MPFMRACPFCGFPTDGQLSGHLPLECIRALASHLKEVRDAAGQMARELETLKARLGATTEASGPPFVERGVPLPPT